MSVEQVQEDDPEYDEDPEWFPGDTLVDVTDDPLVDGLTSRFFGRLGRSVPQRTESDDEDSEVSLEEDE